MLLGFKCVRENNLHDTGYQSLIEGLHSHVRDESVIVVISGSLPMTFLLTCYQQVWDVLMDIAYIDIESFETMYT